MQLRLNILLFPLGIIFLFFSCGEGSDNAIVTSEKDSLEIQALLDKSEIFNASKQYDSTIQVCTEIIELDPTNQFAVLRRAYAYRMTGELEKCIADYNYMLLVNPYNKNALVNRGSIAYDHQKYDYAIADFNKIIEGANIFPDSMYMDLAYYMLGSCFEETQKWRSALNCYQSALSVGYTGQIDLLYVEIGDCYEMLSANDSAAIYYTKAIEMKPEDHSLYNRRGIVYAKSKLFEMALSDYTKAIELGGNWQSNRALVYREMGDLNKALEDINIAIELMPLNDWAYGNRALILFDMRRYEEAIPDFKEMMKYDTTAFLAFGLGKCYLETDSLDKALQYLYLAQELGSEEAVSELEKIED